MGSIPADVIAMTVTDAWLPVSDDDYATPGVSASS
jgi:hypothetical protein